VNLVEWIYSFQYWVLRIFEQPLIFEARLRFRYSGDSPFESDTPYWVYILMIVGAILLVTGLTSMVIPSRSGFRDDAADETIWDMFMGVVQIVGKIFPAEFRSWGIRLLGLLMFLLGILVSIPVLYWMDQDDDGRLKEYYVEEGTGDLTTEVPERVKPVPTPSTTIQVDRTVLIIFVSNVFFCYTIKISLFYVKGLCLMVGHASTTNPS